MTALLAPAAALAECGPTRLDCAIGLIQQNDFSGAIESLNQELRESPRSLKALNLLGIALTGAGQPEQANRRFEEALAIDSHFYPARKNLAVNEFTLNRHAESAAQFERVLQDSPGDDVAHAYLGELCFEKRQWNAAATHYRKSPQRIAQNRSFTLHYAECLLRQKSSREAVDILGLLAKNDADGRFQAGLLLGQYEAFEAAAVFFTSAVDAGYSDLYTAGYNQVLMLTRAARYPEAIRTADELLTQGFRRAELYNLASEAYSKAGRIQEAYDALRTATQIEPRAEDNYADLVALCLDHENYPLALDILDVGSHYLPNSYRLHVLRGITLVMKGLLDDAEKEFYTASKAAPDKDLPYIALSEVWMQTGQPQKAVDILRPRLNRDENEYLTPYIFAVAVLRSGAAFDSPLASQAIVALNRSIRVNPDFAHSHAALGKLLLGRGDVDGAIAELERAVKLDANDATPAYQLVQAYRKKGEATKARQMLARVSAIHSEERELDFKKELKRLVRTEAR